jgi:hypothetical protein
MIFRGLQQRRHSHARKRSYTAGVMAALCFSCHSEGGGAHPVANRYRKNRLRPRSEGGGAPWSRISSRAASRPHAGNGELRHSGACSPHCHSEAVPQISVWMGSGETCRGIRFALARTGSVRSAARAQARLRPNLRARLQLTSSCPSRSRDSRCLPMVRGCPCQRIKSIAVTVYIWADLLASALQVFRIVS